MAEATGLRNNGLPYPVYGAPWGLVLPILDADGDLVTGATGLDSEISKNGDTFADCTNEATEIATSSGVYYLLLTGTEMTADVVAGITKTSSSGAKTTPWSLYPRKLVTVRSGTSASAGSSTSTIVLDASASAVDDFYNGMLCIATIDGNVEARVISDYVGSTQTASVVPDWNVAPDNNDTFVIKLPEGRHIQETDGASSAPTAGIRKNTASQALEFYVTTTDNVAATGLADGDFSLKRVSLDGASPAAIAGTIVEIDSALTPGWYRVPLAQGETNGNGLVFHFEATDCNPCPVSVQTVR